MLFDEDGGGGYASLSSEAKWFLHAYRYGMRRVLLNSRDTLYVADPYGEWFDAALADQAEEFYRHMMGRDR